MAARQMRWLLAVELLAYLVFGRWLTAGGGGGDSWAAALVSALWLFFGLRVLMVLASYGFLWRYPAQARGSPALSMAGWLRMMAVEYAALLVLFVLIQPWERFWLGEDRLPRTGGRLPLLLIHGYQCNRGFWFFLRDALERAGWPVATHNLEPVLADIDDYAPAIAQRIDAVLAATGATQVIIIGHSMGGLAARAFFRRFGCDKVARLITLGSPHHGSRIAALAWGPNGRQMHFHSPWMEGLASAPLPPGSVSIYSRHDNHVMPAEACSTLPGARDVPIDGVGHLAMALSPRLRDVLLAELRRPAG